VNKTRTPATVVLTTTLPRSANAFYGRTIDELRNRGCTVHIVTSDGPELSSLRERADKVHIITMERTISPLADLRALWAWLRLLRAIRPTLILGGTPKAALLGLAAARLTRVPRRVYFLLGLRLEGTTGTMHRVLAAMEWLTSWSSHEILAVSPSLAARYQQLHLSAGRPVEVPNHGSTHGVDPEYFSPTPRSRSFINDLGMDPDVPIALFIGRLTADKGPDALIDAFGLLRQDRVGLQLLVLGDQDEEDSTRYRERLEASTTAVRVIDHVTDVRPYLAAADLLVLPTRREGMPNVVLEAAAMRVPAVTTTATGASDSVVDGKTGILVPPDDPRSLATAIRRLLVDPGLRQRMGESARTRAVRLFAPDDVARAIADLALGQRADQLSEAEVSDRT
jgi:glycosyltransferase involved in cell wall biosynthesis